MASGMPTGCPVMCGVGGTAYSVVKVRSSGLAPWPVGSGLARVCALPDARGCVTGQHFIRSARSSVYLPRPARGLGV